MPKLLLTVPLALLLCFWPNINVRALEPAPDAKASLRQPLKKRSGYLLMGIDSHNSAASLKFQKYPGSRLTRGTTINLQMSDSSFRLVPLAAGEYQITEVLAPYYDLPYRLNVGDRPTWRFRIKAGRVNYVGSIVIKAQRSKRNVDIRLLNRLASSLAQIEQEYKRELELYPLAIGVAYEDSFLESLGAAPNE